MTVALALLFTAASAITPPTTLRNKYARHRGYIGSGADLANGTMSVEKGLLMCDVLPECAGITLTASAKWDTLTPQQPVQPRHHLIFGNWMPAATPREMVAGNITL